MLLTLYLPVLDVYDLFFLIIKDLRNNMEITCLDSYKMLNTSLDEVLTELNTSIRKRKIPV